MRFTGAVGVPPDSTVQAPVTSPVRVERSAGAVVALVAARKAARSGVLWGLIFGVAIASSEISYVKIYPNAAQRDALAAAYGSNKAMSALFGPAPQLQTVGGFTAFKISMTLMVLGAVWGLLTSTRLLRGEEDAGRWDLLLGGPTTPRRAAAQGIAGLGVGALTLWVTTAIITALSGRDSTYRDQLELPRCTSPWPWWQRRSCSSPSGPSPANWRPPAARPLPLERPSSA